MINTSKVLTSIKMDLGIYGLNLPFDNPDEVLMNVIEVKTLPTFSQFSPYYREFIIDAEDMVEIQANRGTYESKIFKIPDMFGDADILYIRSVDVDISDLYDGYMDPIYITNTINYQDLLLGQAEANLASIAVPSVTFKFHPPNKLELFNSGLAYETKYRITVALTHSNNLTTIPKTKWTSFMRLATLDVKKFLYDNLKLYNNLQTAYANIDLKLDEWSNAESDRESLISEWENVWHLDDEQYIIL